MSFYAEKTRKGRTLASLGPFASREDAESAAIAAWPDAESVTISRERAFDIRWINPRRILSEREA